MGDAMAVEVGGAVNDTTLINHARSEKRIAVFLTKQDEDDLRFLWNDLEAALGYRSSQGSVVNRLGGLSSEKVEAFVPFEGFACWSNSMGRRVARVRRALRAMSPEAILMLYRVYGPCDPNASRLLGELRALAEYTPTVERHRERMVDEVTEMRIHGARTGEESRVHSAETVVAAARVRIERARAEIIRLRELRGERGLDDDERAELGEWRRAVRAAERRIEDALRPRLSEASLERAAEGIVVSTNREVTTADALRALLGEEPKQAPGESRRVFERRQRIARAERQRIVRPIQQEAEALLAEAEAAYIAAKEAA